jgi:hypothetical protein
MNNLGTLRTHVDNRERQARGQELIGTWPDAHAGIYKSEGSHLAVTHTAEPGDLTMAPLTR